CASCRCGARAAGARRRDRCQGHGTMTPLTDAAVDAVVVRMRERVAADSARVARRRVRAPPAVPTSRTHLPTQPTAQRNYTMGYRRSHFFKSAYLRAQDLTSSLILTIRHISEELIGPERQLRCVISFDETDQKLVMNATNWGTL